MEMHGIKVFTATKAGERNRLGETATEWLQNQNAKPGFEVVDRVVTQSSDNEFHCISITLFYRMKPAPSRTKTRANGK